MKFENNWKYKTLENLEKSVWPPLDPSEGSYLVKTCNALRKKQLKDFSVEDLRIMIGQDIGLKFLIPLAIEVLNKNILAEGNLYEGDLLKSVLTSDKEYSSISTENLKAMCNIFEQNEQKLNETETTWEIRKSWFASYREFKKYVNNENH